MSKYSSNKIWETITRAAMEAGERRLISPANKGKMLAMLAELSAFAVDDLRRDEPESKYAMIGEMIGFAYSHFGNGDEWQTAISGGYVSWVLGYTIADYMCRRVQKEAFIASMDWEDDVVRKNLDALREKKLNEDSGKTETETEEAGE